MNGNNTYDSKMLALRKAQPQGGEIAGRSKAVQQKDASPEFLGRIESSVAYKEPGAISGSKTADDVIKRKKINLGGQGEAGTGVVTIPKGTDKQQLDYEVAVRRRMNPGIYDKLDALKRDATPSYDFGSNRKPGAGIVYKGPNYEEEGAGEAKYRKFLEEVTSEDEGDTGYLPDEGDTGYLPDEDGTGSDEDGTKLPPIQVDEVDPIEKAADVYEPFAGEDVDTTDKDEREEFGMDASEKQYDKEYASQTAVLSDVVVGGKPYQGQLFSDGAFFLVSADGLDEIPLRQGNKKQ